VRATRRCWLSSPARCIADCQHVGEGSGDVEGREEALLDLYRKLRPGELTTIESARGLINNLFYNPKRYDLTRVGRYKLDLKFGRKPVDLDNYDAGEHGLLSHDDMLDTIRYLMVNCGWAAMAIASTTSTTSATAGSVPSAS
jgi:hypothetical protein